MIEDINFGENNYSKLKLLCRKMNQMIDMPVDKGFDLETLFYRVKTKDPTEISFEVNPRLKPYLAELNNNFTAYYFENIARLNSYYSIRIYELLKQYQQKNGNGWWTIKIDELREILNITEQQYIRYNDFKRKVLIQAQTELQEKTDIQFKFEEFKTGRKITSIKFIISDTSKKQNQKDIKIIEEQGNNKNVHIEKTDNSHHQKDLVLNMMGSLKNSMSMDKKEDKSTYDKEFKVLEYFELSNQDIKNLIKNYDKDIIISNAEYTVNQIKKNKIQNPVAFLRKAVKDNYAKSSNNNTNITNNINKISEEKQKQILKEKRLKESQIEKDKSIILQLEQRLKQINNKRLDKFVEKNLDGVYKEYLQQVEQTKNYMQGLSLRDDITKSDLIKTLREDNSIPIISFRGALTIKYPINISLIQLAKKNNIILEQDELNNSYRIIH